MRPNLSQFTLLMILLAIPVVQWIVHRDAPSVIEAAVDSAATPRAVIAPEATLGAWADSAACTAAEITRLGQVGQVTEAMDLTRYALALPRHPDRNDPYGRGHATLALDRMLEVFEAYELWDDAISFCTREDAVNIGNALVESKRLRLLSVAFAAKRQLTFRSQILTSYLNEVLEDLNLRESNDEHHNEICVPADVIEIDYEGNEAARKHIANSIKVVEAQLQAMRGNMKDALPKLAETDASALQHARMLFAADKKSEALVKANQHLESTKFRTPALAVLAELQFACDETGVAKSTLDELSQLMANHPADSSLRKRLRPLAAKANVAWAQAPTTTSDGEVFLAELKNALPTHIDAPEFELTGVEEKTHALSDYRGKPVLVVFYLGRECLHCSRQLKNLAPVAFEFEDLGVPILGISSDDAVALNRSFKGYRGRIPYPLASDGKLDVFRSYRLQEDGMDEPLHGTFLLDAEGKVVWRDMGEEPFMDMDFLLKEVQRLLLRGS